MFCAIARNSRSEEVEPVCGTSASLHTYALAPTAGLSQPLPGPTASTDTDLTPPARGWIAFLDPQGHLNLVDQDASRLVPLREFGQVTCYGWSPNGAWLAVVSGRQLALISMADSRRIARRRILTVLAQQWGAVRSPLYATAPLSILLLR